MGRTFRLGVLLGLFAVAGLAFPSAANAQRGGGSGHGGGARGGASVSRGGAVYRGGQVAVPRTRPPYAAYRPYYSHPYYYRPYYYRPYYAGYYPYYYSPWSFSLSFGVGYPYPYPYAAAPPAYSYPTAYAANEPLNTAAVSRTDDRGAFGTLSIRVRPADALILIDQQAWDRPQGDDRFSIDVAEGPHQIEIRKAGYATYVRTIDVPRGEPAVLNVSLTTGGGGAIQVTRTVPLPFRHE